MITAGYGSISRGRLPCRAGHHPVLCRNPIGLNRMASRVVGDAMLAILWSTEQAPASGEAPLTAILGGADDVDVAMRAYGGSVTMDSRRTLQSFVYGVPYDEFDTVSGALAFTLHPPTIPYAGVPSQQARYWDNERSQSPLPNALGT
jgi:hypothetical protein